MENLLKITGYEIVNMGQEHAQYFQGCSAMFPFGGVQYDEVYVGVGDNSKAAYENAVETINYDAELYEEFSFPKNPPHISKRDKVSAKDLSESDCELQCYVAIYVKTAA